MNQTTNSGIIDTLQVIANAGLDSGATITLSGDCSVENMKFREGNREFTIKDVRVSDPRYMRFDELVGAEEMVEDTKRNGLNAIKDIAVRECKAKALKLKQDLNIESIPDDPWLGQQLSSR